MTPSKTDSIALEDNSIFLFVGPADSGKSYAATSWGLKSKEFGGTDDRPCLVLELDGRVRGLRGRPVVFNSFTNEDGATGVLNAIVRMRDNCYKFKQAPFHTLIVDSFSAFCELAIAESLDVTNQKNAASSKDKAGRRRGDLQLLTTEDYGFESEAVRQLLWENLIDIRRYANVIVTAHEVTKYKMVKGAEGAPTVRIEDGLKVLARDAISAKLPTRVDEIYHFQGKEVVNATHTIRRTVCFQDELARTSYPQLAKTTLPYDITNKEFYPLWKGLISG